MNKRIYIVEDEIIVSMEIQDRLLRLGYLISGTSVSGEDALEEIPASNSDLVLMDIRLSGTLGGIETVELLKEFIEIPVVFITAYSDKTTIDKMIAVDPAGYILKPISDLELLAAIESALIAPYDHEPAHEVLYYRV